MNAPVTQFRAVPQEDLDWLGTGPIPAAAYYDPAYYELEREAVFRRGWVNVGHVSELPATGGFIKRELEFAKASLLIVRGRDQQIRAFHNVCTHRGTQLIDEAQGTNTKFSCRYHMWTFSDQGALLSAPDFEAFGVSKESCGLTTVRLEIVAGLIFVNLSGTAETLRESLGVFADQMEATPVARATGFSEYHYEVEANWKLCFDNFQENYHLRFIHPQTGHGGVGTDNPFGYPQRYRFEGPHRGQTIWYNVDAPPQGPVQQMARERNFAALMQKGMLGGESDNEYFVPFPNIFMLGSPFQNFTHIVYPISASRSRGVIRVYWVGEPDTASEAFGREYHLMMLRDVHSEDLDVIEAGQRGLSSGALKHIHFQTQEALCRHLFMQVDQRVERYRRELGEGA